MRIILLPLLIAAADAFPGLGQLAGWDSALLDMSQHTILFAGAPQTAKQCSNKTDRQGAAPWNSQYPYNSAQNGLPGNGSGGYRVPHPDDEAHAFEPPGPQDIRGPCPGLNALANHHFISHDGVTTMNELVDAQQNVYNTDWLLAVVLAILGISAGGDLVTQSLSIGCDATPRTSWWQTWTGDELGLNKHNTFEADTSLTRDDYFLADGNNWHFNGTLFGMMVDACPDGFNLTCLSDYRKDRWVQSQRDNPAFFFAPTHVLLYAAAAFLIELMPSGPDYDASVDTIATFFGAQQDPDDGRWRHKPERLPEKWINREEPLGLLHISTEALHMYQHNPVLFGGNTAPGTFLALGWGDLIRNGTLPSSVTPKGFACFVFQLLLQSQPSGVNLLPLLTLLTSISSIFENWGCPIPF